MTTLLSYMQDLGWDPYANDHEDANCQFEINWTYSDALTTADRHTFFKWMVRTVAEQNGLWATFMPKPFSHLTGNGAHFHMSLADAETRQNVFLDETDALGLSQLGRWFMGGVLHHARSAGCHHGAAGEQLQAADPRSSALGRDVGAGLCDLRRVESDADDPHPGCREESKIASVDGAANPYLACAAMLAAGLDGIENKIDPGQANSENLYEMPEEELRRRNIAFLPTTLREAIDCFEQDEVVQEALGKDYAAYYASVKREEWRQYHQSISQWEREQYLKTF